MSATTSNTSGGDGPPARADLGGLAELVEELVAQVTEGGDADDVIAAITRVPADAIGGFFHATFGTGGNDTALVPLTTGVAASPGAASGEIVLTAEEAIDAAAAGRQVILVRTATTPDEIGRAHV